MSHLSKTPQETKALAQELLNKNPSLKLVLLKGDLGSGKTTFVKGLAQALGIPENKVKSPTFALREDHGPLIHYDLYRIETEDPLLIEQIKEDLQGKALVAVEWPERLAWLWEESTVKVTFVGLKEDQRELNFTPPL